MPRIFDRDTVGFPKKNAKVNPFDSKPAQGCPTVRNVAHLSVYSQFVFII